MNLGDKVKVISGDYQGYYGEIMGMGEDVALVSHNPGVFHGFWVNIQDLEIND